MNKFLLATGAVILVAASAHAADVVVYDQPYYGQPYYQPSYVVAAPSTVYYAPVYQPLYQPVYYPRYERVRGDYNWGYWNENQMDSTDVKTSAEHHAGDRDRMSAGSH